MTDAMQRILADLPAIKKIADGPMAQNPLLPIVLQQALALAQISDWSANAQKGVADEKAPPAAESKPVVLPPAVQEILKTYANHQQRSDGPTVTPVHVGGSP